MVVRQCDKDPVSDDIDVTADDVMPIRIRDSTAVYVPNGSDRDTSQSDRPVRNRTVPKRCDDYVMSYVVCAV